MALIEKIGYLREQGLSSEEIVRTLQEEGVSPREISEALEQSQVKSAVSEGMPGMQPSLMAAPVDDMPNGVKITQQKEQQFQQENVERQMQEGAREEYAQAQQAQEEYASTQEAQQEYYPAPQAQQEYYEHPQTGEEYQYQPAQYAPAQTDTEMIAEIAEQVANEKFEKIQSQISEALRFKVETEGRINSINERVRRMEVIIDRLQSAILGKIGEYGKDISELKQELETTQESFSKVLEPITGKAKEEKRIEHHKKPEAKHHKKSDSFAHYLRR